MNSINNDPQEAILIMDSRKNISNVRSSTMSTAWNKLYKVGDAFLDISLKSDQGSTLLVGQVISEKQLPSGHILVYGQDQSVKFAQGIDQNAGFRFELDESDAYKVEMKLGQDRYLISNLNLN